jgi:glutamyl-tRNA synthetase
VSASEQHTLPLSAGNKPVVTRFAPSPTGFLHIGGARTALFNWLYAKRCGGKFLLRIEDTDRARSTDAAIAAILDGMRWLGLDWDGDEVYQFARADRHAAVAQQLVAAGHAYRCFLTQDELAEMRAAAQAEKRPFRIASPWRDADSTSLPNDVPAVVRLKAPREGRLTISDRVQGDVSVDASEIDDFVLLRSDGTPTYMLSVVVDDHDMGVTHVIRGDDHLNNAFRQMVLLNAMDAIEGGWPVPVYAHVPLIHGSDGAKLSKRHGALGVDAYRDEMGMLPEAVNNYLLRLGWGHGDDEIISRDDAIAWFDVDAVGRSPARFDIKKLENLNGHYMREADDARLADLAAGQVADVIERPLDDADRALLASAMPALKPRAKTLIELAEGALFLFDTVPLTFDEKAASLLTAAPDGLIVTVSDRLAALDNWTMEALDATVRAIAEELGLGLGKVAQPLRAALTGRAISPGIFDVLFLLGRDESLRRLGASLSQR